MSPREMRSTGPKGEGGLLANPQLRLGRPHSEHCDVCMDAPAHLQRPPGPSRAALHLIPTPRFPDNHTSIACLAGNTR
jgi:hypothetical protein